MNMDEWRKLLAEATRQNTLDRARNCVGKNTVYKLGKGGMNPAKSLTMECDCSGFVAWAIGIPRELPPGSGKWLQTTTYWQGGEVVGITLFDPVNEGQVETGDIYVYPDMGSRQGHMGIISSVEGGKASKVIHCSSGNFRNHGDAILETNPAVFSQNCKSRIMRVDYTALRAYCNIAEPEDGSPEQPLVGVTLKCALLAGDATLQAVAAGNLILEPTGRPTGGCGPIQDALNRLATVTPSYAVDLGENQKERGYYGSKTATAIQNFQRDKELEVTGEVDAATLGSLDDALGTLSSIPPGGRIEEPGAGSIVDAPPVRCRITVQNRDYFGSIDNGEDFYIGKKVSYGSFYGLTNYFKKIGEVYRPEDYVAEHGYWAHFIYPTALCESNSHFNRVNTYDSARFTFGFFQFAAHTPNENFVKLFRSLLTIPAASSYFPDLLLVNDFICRRTSNGTVQLENQDSTEKLMNYLNPSLDEVEEIEAILAAKLIHWCNHDPEHRKIQVETAINKVRTGMQSYSRSYGLHGKSDKICLVIADIRHQGRAHSREIHHALDTGGNEEKAFLNLLDIGAHIYESRIQTLKQEIDRLTAEGILGCKRYNQTVADFQ